MTAISENQRRTLAAICEALVPSIQREDDPEGFFATGALELGTLERVERLIGVLEDPADVARLKILLSTLGSRVANLLLGGRFQRMDRMPVAVREAVLARWALSRVPLRRAGFQALKRLVHVAHYCWPGNDGTHPAWRHVGYSGPLPQPEAGVSPLSVLSVDRDTTLDCDVVVVGSGAGGGVVAGVLARAGLAVVVLEKGPNPGAADMTQVEGEMLGLLYLGGGLMMTENGSMPVLAGSCVGGGTTINYTTSFPLPDFVRREWDLVSGLSLFESTRFSQSLDHVGTRLGVGTRWCKPGNRDEILQRGCRKLGWHVDVIPRNVTDCREGAECGFCGYGCRHGAKNSTSQTYLRDALQRDARLVAGCDVERVLVERDRATGVRAIVRGAGGAGHELTVRARMVVVACGAVHTPALLVRSGLRNHNIGRGLRLHPATALLGLFDERVEPWTGSLQTRYSDELADLDGGYGAKFETAPVHFALAASAFGWESAAQHREDVGRLAYSGLVGVLLRDRDAGRVKVTRAGRPRVSYELSDYDVAHMRRGLLGAAEVLAAAGAKQIVSLQTPPARIDPGDGEWRDSLAGAMDTRGYRGCRMSYVTFHQLASAAMGREPKASVVGEMGESHDVSGLFVADASTFPTSSGVNPMITIMAIADHVARGITETW